MGTYLPVLSSEAGSCLTIENWLEIGVKSVVFYLDELLLKPGIELLNQLDDLASFVGWKGTLILNASRLVANKNGQFVLKSPYDGSQQRFTYSELFSLVARLKPDFFVFPPNTLHDYPEVWEDWPAATTPVIQVEEVFESQNAQSCKIYFGEEQTFEQLKQRLRPYLHKSCYVMGAFNQQEIKELQQLGVEYIESDEPSRAAFDGLVYIEDGELDLKDIHKKMCFESIVARCACPTCSQGLTQAYLYHLLSNTPLLCQRFLIQHNVYQVLS